MHSRRRRAGNLLVRRWLTTHELRGLRLPSGRGWRISQSALDEWFRRREEAEAERRQAYGSTQGRGPSPRGWGHSPIGKGSPGPVEDENRASLRTPVTEQGI
jgi:excisionase family DNA binding protein